MAYIAQHEVAQLTDVELKKMVLAYMAAADEGGSAAALWRALGNALIRAVQQRERTMLVAEAEMLDDDEEGCLADDLDEETLRQIRDSRT
ncbi:hypothetical protein ASD11_07310 [Aeromicrobium sp. Root495]|nr:hypothetical protein ASD11_07310 [Aeromicrobium sp. Root495]